MKMRVFIANNLFKREWVQAISKFQVPYRNATYHSWVCYRNIRFHLSNKGDISIYCSAFIADFQYSNNTFARKREKDLFDNVESIPIRQTWRYTSFIKTYVTCTNDTNMYTNELFIKFFHFDEDHVSYYLIISCV